MRDGFGVVEVCYRHDRTFSVHLWHQSDNLSINSMSLKDRYTQF